MRRLRVEGFRWMLRFEQVVAEFVHEDNNNQKRGGDKFDSVFGQWCPTMFGSGLGCVGKGRGKRTRKTRSVGCPCLLVLFRFGGERR